MRSLRKACQYIAQTARLMVGVPDYETYVARHRSVHPSEPEMTLAEFHRNRVEQRYGAGPNRAPRCC
jgi:uncharacterized short protein YbdD (DUF466 family)